MNASPSFVPREPDTLQALFPDFEARRLIGRGGMGAVYEAWQKSLERMIALKILPPELLRSSDFLDRFQREARVMARMDHPNIARVYGNGITDDGEAYIVMELIEGVSITHYVAEKGLSLHRILELFLQICSGVEHAHQKGIIHRDLKPSNILVAEVNGTAVPKVIDFGLAKPEEHSQHDDTIWLSASQAVGTPAYMSPEQAAGEEIDSRSDIYSLGTLLFELLTGDPPIENKDLDQGTRSVIAKRIQSTPIPRPSDRRAGEAERSHPSNALASKLQGDLDAIVIKALEKRPEHRYETVTGLAEDVRRYLTHQPVRAIAPTTIYLIQKFCRRHRTVLGAAGLLLFLLLSGIAYLIHESVLTRRAERLAAERLERGEKLIEFMLGDLHGKLHTVGRLDILETTIDQVETFYTQNASTNLPSESLRNLAHAKVQLGRIRNTQGKPEAAKSHYEEAIQLYKTALERNPASIAWKEELGQTWNSLAVFHHSRGEAQQAEDAYGKALLLADDLLRAEPKNANWADFKASALHNYAALCEAGGRLSDAETNYSEALRLWEPIQAAAPNNIQILEHLSHLHLSLAFLHGRLGQLDKAEHSNGEALRLREQIVQMNTNNFAAIDLLADIQQNIAQVHLDRNRISEADEWIHRYLPTRERLASHDPSNTSWSSKLADAWSNLAHLRAKQENVESAVEAFRKSCNTLRPFADDPRTTNTLHTKWLEKLKESATLFEPLSWKELKNGNISAAHRASQMVFDCRAWLANESLTNHHALFELALASLDLAKMQRAGTDIAKAKSHVQLAVLLIEKCAKTGMALHVRVEQLQTIQEFIGISFPQSHTESQNDTILLDASTLPAVILKDAQVTLLNNTTLRIPKNLLLTLDLH